MSKKEMIQSNLPKTYDSKESEKRWYKVWEEGNYFVPRKGKTGESFCIIMPPPNVTGKLHMGHALDNVAQDVLTRFKRMKGFETLWLPGKDHAGISTQAVVEKLVYEQEGKTRHEVGRNDFLDKIWKWKEEYGDLIEKQLRYMGVSCDWTYSMFTMDPEANEAVRKVFVDLYNEGLIYQADRIINWDPVLQSAISDAEVEHEEVQGAFYHIYYPVKDSEMKLEVATTRPETLLGDTAVAVNPKDDRFKHLIGKHAIVPLCNREVPIIGDEHVDIELGTGCLKVTPGHDFNDFEIGKRHNLEIVNILNKDGTLNEEAGEFEGLSCKKARAKVVEKLKNLGLFVKEEKHVHQVGHGQRSGEIVEPMVSKQWFLNVGEMAKVAVEAVESDKTRFFPKSWENTYFSWLREPRDWCISRQLWWGHQIPIFYCNGCEHQWASIDMPTKCEKCDCHNIEQDPDVLDTWFSSGLWPFSTLGWPDKKRMEERKFNTFFPTTVLVTGFDIIFFWVARMMMMTLKTIGEIPFKHVYIHALVRDKEGRKMSKSLGNGIDPIEMIDQYGADALRYTLAAGSGYNRNLNLDPERIGGYRNFINKIWNAFRFIHPFLGDGKAELPPKNELNDQDRWILAELNTITKKMNDSIEEYRFDDACSALYSFIYDSFCSWYIEMSKNVLYGDNEKAKANRASVLKYSFRKIVALLHPIAPYITEELWQELKEKEEDLLIASDYPEYDSSLEFPSEQEKMNKFIEVVTLIRNLRASFQIKPKDEVPLQLFTDDEALAEFFVKNERNLFDLSRAKDPQIHRKSVNRPKKSAMSATSHTEVFIPLEGIIDIDEQIKKITKDLEKAKQEYEKFEKKLSNKNFVDRAPHEVITEVKEKAAAIKEKVESLENSLKNFQ